MIHPGRVINLHLSALDLLWKQHQNPPPPPSPDQGQDPDLSIPPSSSLRSLQELQEHLARSLQSSFPPKLCPTCLRKIFLPMGTLLQTEASTDSIRVLKRENSPLPGRTNSEVTDRTVAALNVYLFNRLAVPRSLEEIILETLLLMWNYEDGECTRCDKPVLCEVPKEITEWPTPPNPSATGQEPPTS